MKFLLIVVAILIEMIVSIYPLMILTTEMSRTSWAGRLCPSDESTQSFALAAVKTFSVFGLLAFVIIATLVIGSKWINNK